MPRRASPRLTPFCPDLPELRRSRRHKALRIALAADGAGEHLTVTITSPSRKNRGTHRPLQIRRHGPSLTFRLSTSTRQASVALPFSTLVYHEPLLLNLYELLRARTPEGAMDRNPGVFVTAAATAFVGYLLEAKHELLETTRGLPKRSAPPAARPHSANARVPRQNPPTLGLAGSRH